MTETRRLFTCKRQMYKSFLSLTIVLCACHADVEIAAAQEHGALLPSAPYKPSSHFSRTAHATASGLEGTWQQDPRTLRIAALAKRGSTAVDTAWQRNPSRLRLQFSAHEVLLEDELAQQRYPIIDHPKLRRRSAPEPGEAYAYWEGRVLVVKHFSVDGQSLQLDRYQPAGWSSLALIRRHIRTARPGENFEVRVLFHRPALALP